MREKMRKKLRKRLALLLSAAMLAAVPGSAVLGMEMAEAESVYDEAETVIGAEVAEESPATIILDENEDFAEDDVEENANFGVAAADAGNDQIGADLKEQESGNTDSGVSIISIEEVPVTASVQTDDSETMTVSTVDSGTCGDNLSWTLDSETIVLLSNRKIKPDSHVR
ncbi:MAG: hypothetical protein LUI13_07330, partial [Lachnospiraceae bacterium]|nr:hypothetical protein [Lachnospiraceae bacterium]